MHMTENRTTWPKGLSYEAFLTLAEELAAAGKSSGTDQSEAMAHYTQLNARRMRRLSKTLQLLDAWQPLLNSLQRTYRWRVFTETWCGDAAQSLPVMAAIADASDKIELDILFRDEHPERFSAYLTDGSRSIPKLVAFDANTEAELGTWGPRPAPLQEMVLAYKANPGDKSYATLLEETQLWYHRDRSRLIQAEILQALQEWEAR